MLLVVAQAHPSMHTDMDINDDIATTVLSMLKRSWPRLSSLEVRNLPFFHRGPEARQSCHADNANEQVQMLVLVIMLDQVDADQWARALPLDWRDLYHHLIAQGMVWEFSDIFCRHTQFADGDEAARVESAFRLFGFPYRTRPNITEGTPKDYFDFVCTDWEVKVQDESTSFALLDMFTTMALTYCKDPKFDGLSQRCMALAGDRAADLLAQDENHSMSRPYLRWTMAKLLTKVSYETLEKSIIYRRSHDGSLCTSKLTFPHAGLPIYIPTASEPDETPQWQPKTMKDWAAFEMNELLTVIQAAKELGDTQVQSACLCEMLLWGHEPPNTLVDRLTSIWTEDGNLKMLRELCLFRYMLVRTPAEREQLRRDLLCGGEPVSRKLKEARYRTLAALSCDYSEKDSYGLLANEVESPSEGPSDDDSPSPSSPVGSARTWPAEVEQTLPPENLHQYTDEGSGASPPSTRVHDYEGSPDEHTGGPKVPKISPGTPSNSLTSPCRIGLN
jgi:hypothetical protein